MSSSTSLLIAPPLAHRTIHTTTTHSAPSAPGLHDTLRAATSTQNTTTTALVGNSHHPLAARLATYPQTQQNLHLTLLRRNYGLSAPLIREMELGIVRAGDGIVSRDLALGPGMGLGSVGGGWGRSVHEEVLLGRDWEVDGWEDIYGCGDEFAPMQDFHAEMERRMHMDW